MTKKHILVVDDEVQLANMVKMRLEANNYSVSVAYDGEDALQKVSTNKPDLIILDIVLPKLDGYMICSLLKKNDPTKNIPIILFTAREQEEDRLLGEKVGANAYITKPFGSQVLLEKIKELLAE
jgi:DNA-binding response OmpR family regulator